MSIASKSSKSVATPSRRPSSSVADVRNKFATTRRELSETLIERDEEISLVLTALVAGEHVLLVSPPGCGKSMLLDAVMNWMHGSKFSILLTKFTTPQEVCGPISLAALKDERYRHVTRNRLPEAELAFIDEIWKASSAILNTLLRILNERDFENDGIFVPCPLRMCVAASNEWPSADNGGKELGALFDRFLFRATARPIASAEGERRLLWEKVLVPNLSTSITAKEIDMARADAHNLEWSEDAQKALMEVLAELKKEGINPSDRRKRKAIGAAQAYAWICGGSRVLPEHLEILAYVLWDVPGEQADKCSRVIGRIANPVGMKVNQYLIEIEEIIRNTDVKRLDVAAASVVKLNEIAKGLLTLKQDDPRVIKITKYVKDQIRIMRIGSIEAI